MKRVNVEGLSLTGKHDQDDLNGKEALAVVQLLISNQIVEDLHQVAEEVYVDCMSESKQINVNKTIPTIVLENKIEILGQSLKNDTHKN